MKISTREKLIKEEEYVGKQVVVKLLTDEITAAGAAIAFNRLLNGGQERLSE
jgi:hypothetical protein